MGDQIEAIDHSDKRFDTYTTDLRKIRPELQKDHFVKLVKPYSKNIDVILTGNHEDTLLRYFDYTMSACKELNVPYGTYSCVISYRHNGELLFKVYATHGRGSIKSAADDPIRVEANLNLTLKRKLKDLAGDCAVMMMGHVHKLLVEKPKKTLYMTSDNGTLRQRYKEGVQSDEYIHPDHRYYACTGTFRRTFVRGVSDYGEKAMYPPTVLGFPVILVRNGKIVDCVKEYV